MTGAVILERVPKDVRAGCWVLSVIVWLRICGATRSTRLGLLNRRAAVINIVRPMPPKMASQTPTHVVVTEPSALLAALQSGASGGNRPRTPLRSEEHTSELQSR